MYEKNGLQLIVMSCESTVIFFNVFPDGRTNFLYATVDELIQMGKNFV